MDATIQLLPVNILQFVFCLQSLFAILVLLPKTKARKLSWLLLATACLMAFNLLEELQITASWHLITPAFSLLFGPLFYFFVRQLALNEDHLKRRHLLHFVAPLLSLAATDYVQWILALGTASQLVYFGLSLKLLSVYRQACFDTRSDALSLQLSWLGRILWMMILITLIDLLRLNLQPYLTLALAHNWYFAMQLLFYLLTSYLVVQVIWNPERFDGLQAYIDSYQNSEEEKRQATPVFEQIDKVITEQQLFLQPRLSVNDIAELTGLQGKDISWAVNEAIQLNFSDYINRYRVEAFCKTLEKSQGNSNILQLALDSGFNSKSTFNAVFKKMQGVTPSQYLTSLKS